MSLSSPLLNFMAYVKNVHCIALLLSLLHFYIVFLYKFLLSFLFNLFSILFSFRFSRYLHFILPSLVHSLFWPDIPSVLLFSSLHFLLFSLLYYRTLFSLISLIRYYSLNQSLFASPYFYLYFSLTLCILFLDFFFSSSCRLGAIQSSVLRNRLLLVPPLNRRREH